MFNIFMEVKYIILTWYSLHCSSQYSPALTISPSAPTCQLWRWCLWSCSPDRQSPGPSQESPDLCCQDYSHWDIHCSHLCHSTLYQYSKDMSKLTPSIWCHYHWTRLSANQYQYNDLNDSEIFIYVSMFLTKHFSTDEIFSHQHNHGKWASTLQALLCQELSLPS